ncbi:MAG TPA: Smr/MutS family protein [Burkholderiales bacterium]|nr:Smr/MutS family protein [Burkholderiales bacterium]
MPKSKPALDDDADLFREAVKDVAPLRDSGKVTHPTVRPAPLPFQRMQDDRQVLEDSLSDRVDLEADIESGDALSFLREGMSPQILRRLRAGFWAVQQEVDLHGLRLEEARPLLVDFLNSAVRRGVRCVRVIHGKGRRSKNGEPVLKPRVASWLIQRRDVLAFCEARPVEGGSGAMLVLLRARKTGEQVEPSDEDDLD